VSAQQDKPCPSARTLVSAYREYLLSAVTVLPVAFAQREMGAGRHDLPRELLAAAMSGHPKTTHWRPTPDHL
jgi:hypothetical protein